SIGVDGKRFRVYHAIIGKQAECGDATRWAQPSRPRSRFVKTYIVSDAIWRFTAPVAAPRGPYLKCGRKIVVHLSCDEPVSQRHRHVCGAGLSWRSDIESVRVDVIGGEKSGEFTALDSRC